MINVKLPGGDGFKVVAASGHLDEVQELAGSPVLKLTESELLGEGAFSRVSTVTMEGGSRIFALKRMTK